jgi:hypothetical protein
MMPGFVGERQPDPPKARGAAGQSATAPEATLRSRCAAAALASVRPALSPAGRQAPGRRRSGTPTVRLDAVLVAEQAPEVR